ncbi:MAG: DUF4236 domain-containing protein [Candidatus Aenigmarchaeota archaeon]|nr:DUF4236 domain-containing protein [Candidatus Aenigmarchaeota archaeon]
MSLWSFRRRIKIIPGVRLNLSKSGISTSIGIRGVNLTFGKKGTYLNTRILGTGIHKRQKISSDTKQYNEVPLIKSIPKKQDNIFSVEPEKITSQDMEGIKKSIIEAHNQRKQLEKDIKKIKKNLFFSKIKLFVIYGLIFGFIAKNLTNEFKSNIQKQKNAIIELEEQKNNSYVKLDVEFDKEFRTKYEAAYEAFKKLTTSQKIWDITRAEEQDRIATRSAASTAILRTEIQFDFKDLDDIKYQNKALYLKNANGADLYFYPNFIVMQGKNDFGVIGLNELEFNFSETNFVEQDKVPDDTKIIDKTWLKVNKNGTPDKRFKGNHEIPIVRYGTITISTSTGVNEEYQFSNYEASEQFSDEFSIYKDIIKKAGKIIK